MGLLCKIFTHRYLRGSPVGDEAMYWRCRRCGHRRYDPPPDITNTVGNTGGGVGSGGFGPT